MVKQIPQYMNTNKSSFAPSTVPEVFKLTLTRACVRELMHDDLDCFVLIGNTNSAQVALVGKALLEYWKVGQLYKTEKHTRRAY